MNQERQVTLAPESSVAGWDDTSLIDNFLSEPQKKAGKQKAGKKKAVKSKAKAISESRALKASEKGALFWRTKWRQDKHSVEDMRKELSVEKRRRKAAEEGLENKTMRLEEETRKFEEEKAKLQELVNALDAVATLTDDADVNVQLLGHVATIRREAERKAEELEQSRREERVLRSELEKAVGELKKQRDKPEQTSEAWKERYLDLQKDSEATIRDLNKKLDMAAKNLTERVDNETRLLREQSDKVMKDLREERDKETWLREQTEAVNDDLRVRLDEEVCLRQQAESKKSAIESRAEEELRLREEAKEEVSQVKAKLSNEVDLREQLEAETRALKAKLKKETRLKENAELEKSVLGGQRDEEVRLREKAEAETKSVKAQVEKEVQFRAQAEARVLELRGQAEGEARQREKLETGLKDLTCRMEKEVRHREQAEKDAVGLRAQVGCIRQQALKQVHEVRIKWTQQEMKYKEELRLGLEERTVEKEQWSERLGELQQKCRNKLAALQGRLEEEANLRQHQSKEALKIHHQQKKTNEELQCQLENKQCSLHQVQQRLSESEKLLRKKLIMLQQQTKESRELQFQLDREKDLRQQETQKAEEKDKMWAEKVLKLQQDSQADICRLLDQLGKESALREQLQKASAEMQKNLGEDLMRLQRKEQIATATCANLERQLDQEFRSRQEAEKAALEMKTLGQEQEENEIAREESRREKDELREKNEYLRECIKTRDQELKWLRDKLSLRDDKTALESCSAKATSGRKRRAISPIQFSVKVSSLPASTQARSEVASLVLRRVRESDSEDEDGDDDFGKVADLVSEHADTELVRDAVVEIRRLGQRQDDFHVRPMLVSFRSGEVADRLVEACGGFGGVLPRSGGVRVEQPHTDRERRRRQLST